MYFIVWYDFGHLVALAVKNVVWCLAFFFKLASFEIKLLDCFQLVWHSLILFGIFE